MDLNARVDINCGRTDRLMDGRTTVRLHHTLTKIISEPAIAAMHGLHSVFDIGQCTVTLMCLSIGTPKNNKFSICPKWKIHYFQVSQNLGRVQPHYNVLEYSDT